MKRIRSTQEYKQRKQKSSYLILGIFIMLVASITSKAQTFEIGVFGGAAYYLGDLNPQKHFTESDLAYGGVFKYNLNQRLSFGFTVTQANIKSDASTFNTNHPANTASNLSTQINEFALLGEINFFRYSIGDHKNFWTPYIFGGGAAFSSGNDGSIHFSTPFGLGIKASPFNRIGLNLFWSARKTFTDEIDNVVSIDYQGYNNDWYIFYGLNITFAFRLKKDNGCRNLISAQYN